VRQRLQLPQQGELRQQPCRLLLVGAASFSPVLHCSFLFEDCCVVLCATTHECSASSMQAWLMMMLRMSRPKACLSCCMLSPAGTASSAGGTASASHAPATAAATRTSATSMTTAPGGCFHHPQRQRLAFARLPLPLNFCTFDLMAPPELELKHPCVASPDSQQGGCACEPCSQCIDWRLLLSCLCRGENSCKDKVGMTGALAVLSCCVV
jgi:hypothetical protein